MNLWTSFLNLLYPPKCVFCGRLLQKSEMDLCEECRTSLPRCTQSMKRGECYKECFAAFFYEGAVKSSVRRFKFGGQQQFADAYGRAMAMVIVRERIEFDILSWVPISAKREKKRGYSQTKLLAQAIARELGVRPQETLKKIRDNPAQSSLQNRSQRKNNVKDAYEAYRAERFSGKRILLVDDVMTSGATLSECSRTLRNAGAGNIVCVTLAAVRE